MSILTKFQSDMDQIISNFVPYNNPYIILSWKVPSTTTQGGLETPQEIRSEVLWDGNISLAYPTDLAAMEKYRITGDTSFVIKGWLFPYMQHSSGNIYFIDANFNTTSVLTTYESLSDDTFIYPLSTGLVNETETVSISAYPQITNIDYSTSFIQ